MKIQRFEGVEGYGDRTLHMGGYSEKKQTYRNIKLLLIALLCLGVFSGLQSTWLSKIPLFILDPGSPALCFIFVLAAGYVFGEKEGCVCGLIGGMFTECAEMDPFFGGIMILPLIYCILGYVSGTLSQKVLASNLPSFMVYVMVGGVIEGLCRFGLTAIRISTLPPWHYLIGSFLPRFILTIVFSPVIYLLLKTGKKKLDKI